MPDEYWAKSSGVSLAGHTGDVMEAVAALMERFGYSVPEEWWRVLLYTALFHDIGKICPVFQARMKKLPLPDGETGIPHSLLSLFLIRPDNDLEPRYASVVLSAVAFHHWRDHFPDLLMGRQAEKINKMADKLLSNRRDWEDKLSRVRASLEHLARKFGLETKTISINDSLVEYLAYNNLGGAGLLTPPYALVFLPARLKSSAASLGQEKLRVFVSGNLMRADHFASMAAENIDIDIHDIETGYPLSYDEFDRALSMRFNRDNYWQKEFFVSRNHLQGRNLVLVAPTGVGKTEFAYLWCAGLKTIYTLPMRAAVNKIWHRTSDFVGTANNNSRDSVALLHGDAALEIHTYWRQQGVQEQVTEGERRKVIDLARQLTKPYIMCTADQIAPAALRYPGYERIFAVLMSGALVIDEVQAYDPRAAAIVTHLVQQNSYFGGRTLLITATLPPFILKEIKKRVGLDEDQVIKLLEKENDFLNLASSCRHRLGFAFYNGDFADVRDQVVRAAVDGKKVLVVLNTVQAACRMYENIKDGLTDRTIKTLLFHSRFTQRQRQELERRAVDEYMPNQDNNRTSDPCIIVTTQVVEASVDIDADILFTEPAPADSLVQRMGRVYRRFARSAGNNAPDEANVIIMLNKEMGKDKDIQLSSGLGVVYDRHLTALSLVMLLAQADNPKNVVIKNYEFLDRDPWADCFPRRDKKGGKTKGKGKQLQPNQVLVGLVEKRSERSILLMEKEKIGWVEATYEALELGIGKSFTIDMGSYLRDYQKTLEILDHGYCSDKRRDAMKLFREVSDIQGIPRQLLSNFVQDIANWIVDKQEKISYIELATDILPGYIINCPYRPWQNKKDLFDPFYVDQIIQQLPSNIDKNKTRQKLERWLSDLFVINYPYHDEKGLIYYNLQ